MYWIIHWVGYVENGVATHGVAHFHPLVYMFCFPVPHFLVTLSTLIQSHSTHHSHLLTSSQGWSIQRNNLPQTKQASPVSLKIKSTDLIIDCLLSGFCFLKVWYGATEVTKDWHWDLKIKWPTIRSTSNRVRLKCLAKALDTVLT